MSARLRPARWIPLVLLLIVVLVLAGCSSTQAENPVVMVYKSPTCGCCGKWADHLKANGFQVQLKDVEDIMAVKARYGVPNDLASCHTAIVDGYVVEGHVPAKEVQRLLSERPPIKGIAVPGMPVGSPGMEVPGAPPQPFNVVAFDEAGNTRVFAEYNR